MKELLAAPIRTCNLLAASLSTLGFAGPALAQTGQTQMPMGWQMTWGMGVVCVLGVIVLILGAAALVKYLFFR